MVKKGVPPLIVKKNKTTFLRIFFPKIFFNLINSYICRTIKQTYEKIIQQVLQTI
jgi:hypothetical protein